MSSVISAAGMEVLAEIENSKDVMPVVKKLRPALVLFSVGNQGGEDLRILSLLHKAMPKTIIAALLTGEIIGQENAALAHGAQLVIRKTSSRAEILNLLLQVQSKSDDAQPAKIN